jgi:hypothetical protein
MTAARRLAATLAVDSMGYSRLMDERGRHGRFAHIAGPKMSPTRALRRLAKTHR